ncbi:unnamed protein product [Prorocentrum cordatum]|uniref:Casein kinase I n=1 Tax=Prorocentrum cordatum TaxID=2364126 RepID=A0ABN9X101_9DINO|nr:unnamed protein product [Polarella glacialis]
MYDGSEFVALKYPVNREEEEFCQALQGQLCLGVPRIFDMGWHSEECYVVVQLLGAPVSRLFELLAPWDVGVKWQVLRVLGRQLVRRLRAVHRMGFVHCDVNASNILLGGEETWALPEPRGAAQGPSEPHGPGEAEDPQEVALGCRPFLIDFGCARRFPDGEPMLPYWGSIDYTSINALTSECCRGPHDDLESLGWLLLHGLFRELPWTQWVQAAWSANGVGEASMTPACQQVRLAKVALLELGHGAFEPRWAHLAELPADLCLYLRRCRAQAAAAAAATELEPVRPAGLGSRGAGAARALAADHEVLLQILGCPGGLDDHDAERLTSSSCGTSDSARARGRWPAARRRPPTARSRRGAASHASVDGGGASSPGAPPSALGWPP